MNIGVRKWGTLIILSIIWGSSYILIKKGLSGLTAIELGSIRIMITTIIVAPFGYSKIKTFSNIHVPYLKNNIILIVVLISLEIIKELPITMILRPFNFETFSTQAYVYASQDLLEAAALPSLFLISWATILIIFSSKYILSQKN